METITLLAQFGGALLLSFYTLGLLGVCWFAFCFWCHQRLFPHAGGIIGTVLIVAAILAWSQPWKHDPHFWSRQPAPTKIAPSAPARPLLSG